MIYRLNHKLRGWGLNFRHLVASQAFGYLDSRIFAHLKRWMRRRHPNKSITWCCREYFRTVGNDRWVFSAKLRSPEGKTRGVDLVKLGRLPIRRHVQIRLEANPFDPAYGDYFHQRRGNTSRSAGTRWSPWQEV